jgi:hypothetical protein
MDECRGFVSERNTLMCGFFIDGSVIVTVCVLQWLEFLATDPELRVRFPALPYFLRNSGSGTGSTQPREYT